MSASLLQTLLEVDCALSEADAQRATAIAEAWLSCPMRKELDELFAICESPMERRFLLGILQYVKSTNELDLSVRGEVRFRHGDFEHCIDLQLQQYDWDGDGPSDHPYARIDAVLYTKGSTARIAVEIDGHEFHERTKEQAARDKFRDRKLVRDGFRVVRFTGSEVFANVGSCWTELLGIAEDLFHMEQQALTLFRRRMRDELLDELTSPAERQLPVPQPSAVEASEAH